jgi:hypothetical protein
VVSLLLALVLAPWTHPLAFPATPGWTTGASGNTRLICVTHNQCTRGLLESAAWIARGVRYRGPATADPPNKTLAALPRRAVIVWAVIEKAASRKQPRIQLDLSKAKRYACCDAARIPAEYELTGSGPDHAYSVIVRIYCGSKPNAAIRAMAQHALRRLDLPGLHRRRFGGHSGTLAQASDPAGRGLQVWIPTDWSINLLGDMPACCLRSPWMGSGTHRRPAAVRCLFSDAASSGWSGAATCVC